MEEGGGGERLCEAKTEEDEEVGVEEVEEAEEEQLEVRVLLWFTRVTWFAV